MKVAVLLLAFFSFFYNQSLTFAAKGGTPRTLSANSADSDDGEFEDGSPSDDPGNGDSEPVSGVGFSQPQYSGAGCPVDSVSFALSPDAKSFTILFSAFEVTTNQAHSTISKTCTIRVPFTVPKGYSAMITKSDLRGFVHVPKKAQALIQVDMGLSTHKRTKKHKKYGADIEKEFYLTTKKLKLDKWSQCNQNFVLDMSIIAEASAKKTDEQVTMYIDSADTSAVNREGAKFFLKWKKCKNNIRSS